MENLAGYSAFGLGDEVCKDVASPRTECDKNPLSVYAIKSSPDSKDGGESIFAYLPEEKKTLPPGYGTL